VLNDNFCFTDHQRICEPATIQCGDPFWPYELYDALLQEFVDGDGPDAVIPVSSVNLLIYKDIYMEIGDCPDLDYHVSRLLAEYADPRNPSNHLPLGGS